MYVPITIDKIIDFCEKNFNFEAGDNREKYIKFLEWQIGLHKYDMAKWRTGGKSKPISTGYLYGDILRDKLLLFSYVIGETPVIDKDSKERRLGRNADNTLKPVAEERVKDLELLSIGSIGYRQGRNDTQLCRLVNRLDSIRYVTYAGFINELGIYEPVKEYYGMQITYSNVEKRPKKGSLMMPEV